MKKTRVTVDLSEDDYRLLQEITEELGNATQSETFRYLVREFRNRSISKRKKDEADKSLLKAMEIIETLVKKIPDPH